MPVLAQADRCVSRWQGNVFHNSPSRRLWKSLISTFLLWRNYKDERSVLKKPGPRNAFRPEVPIEPGAGTEKSAICAGVKNRTPLPTRSKPPMPRFVPL